VEKDATLTKLEILCGSYEEKARDYREKAPVFKGVEEEQFFIFFHSIE
jgi:hypothetical protein